MKLLPILTLISGCILATVPLLAAPRKPPAPLPPVITAPALSGDYLCPDLVSNAKPNAKRTYITVTLRRPTVGMTPTQIDAAVAHYASWKGKVVRFP